MAIELKVTTGNGTFKGSASNLASYTSNEESTPVIGSDSSGATGSISFSVVEDPNLNGSIMLLNNVVTLTDGSNGITQGTVNSVSTTDGNTNITADNKMNLFVAQVVATPFVGTLGNALLYYMGLVGITSNYVIDPTISGRSVVYPGFSGSLWDYIKQICVAQQIEVSLVSNNVYFRPIRLRVAEVLKNTTEAYNVSNQQLAQNVEVYYYNNVNTVAGLIYPKGGWNATVGTYQVDSGKRVIDNIPVDVYISSLQQPIPQLTVAQNYTGPNSVYSVSGNDGLPIDPNQWINDGGSLTVAIGLDGKSIDVTIVGPPAGTATASYGPFTIGVASTTSNYFSTLRIVGNGVFFSKTLVRYPTGVPATKTATVVGATIDNPFLSSLSDANAVGWRAAAYWGGPVQTIGITATVINRKGDKGSTSYPTFAAFNALYPTQTFSAFDALMGAQTYATLDTNLYATVQDSFANQAFGNVAGARVLYLGAWYRIRTASIDQAQITYTAELDTVIGDFDTVWTGKTFAQFNTRWTGHTFADLAVSPLWT